MYKKVSSALCLIGAALIWGGAFVAQRTGLEYLGPFSLNGVRCLMGAALLGLYLLIRSLWRRKHPAVNAIRASAKKTILSGLLCGVLLFLASSIQQIGLQYTTAGKAGFLTACYILIVPVLGLFTKRRPPYIVWIAVALGLVGLYLLCMSDGWALNRGDGMILLCALLFSLHILAIDRFVDSVDPFLLSFLQFLVCGLLSLIPILCIEKPTLNALLLSWLPLCYAGFLSCGVAYTLQILGQKGLSPSVAALLLSLESAFAALFGWLLLNESFTLREGLGCIILFAAILLAQLPSRKKAL